MFLELPKVPPIKKISHPNFDTIVVLLDLYPKDLDYVTTFMIFQYGSKISDDVIIHSKCTESKFPIARLGEGELRNGTMYTIVVKSKSIVGESEVRFNYSIPRMGKNQLCP